jgi:hypothetical protein
VSKARVKERRESEDEDGEIDAKLECKDNEV